MFKLYNLDKYIILLMFALLPVDMLNGLLLKNNVNFPISLGQLFKLLILLFLFFRFLFYPKALFISITLTLLLFIPTVYQLIKGFEEPFIFEDIIKISKYLSPVFSFLFFSTFIKTNGEDGITLLFKFIKFSYIVLVGNIFLKYLGLGYPMYEFGNIGSKGFFYAGNEVSALLIIVSSILGYQLWSQESRLNYLFFAALSLFAGLTVSSKTGTVGLLIVFILIPMKRPSLKFNIKKGLIFVISILTLLPLAIYAAWRSIQNTDLMIRLVYFSEKFDFLTFILSSRNVFFRNVYKTYIEKYDAIEKIIGVGQTKYEYLNTINVVEIDFADILFAYGIMGILYFILLMLFLIAQAIRFSKSVNYPHAGFVLLMALVILGVSSTAGHVYSSGMSAIFIGALFAMMYFRKDKNIELESQDK